MSPSVPWRPFAPDAGTSCHPPTPPPPANLVFNSENRWDWIVQKDRGPRSVACVGQVDLTAPTGDWGWSDTNVPLVKGSARQVWARGSYFREESLGVQSSPDKVLRGPCL